MHTQHQISQMDTVRLEHGGGSAGTIDVEYFFEVSEWYIDMSECQLGRESVILISTTYHCNMTIINAIVIIISRI